MTRRMLRQWGAVLGISGLVVVTSCLLLGGGIGLAAPAAHEARTTKKITETASFHLVKKKGSILKEQGTATGTLPGSVSARFDTSNIAKITGTVTFYPTSGGSLTTTAVGYPQSVGTIAKFNGNLAVRRGTGRYANALGSGTFTGTVNRRTWALTVHAKATLTY